MRQVQHFINGQHVAGSGARKGDIYNPNTGQIQAQVDFAADVAKIKSSGVDAVFAYMTEEESARFLIEAKKQGLRLPIASDTVLISQKVIK